MNWTAILAAMQAAIGVVSSPVAQQLVQLIGAFESALPAIEKGVASAEPFIVGAIKLLGNGGAAIPDADWSAQMALLNAQIDAVDQQVAADDAARP